MPYAFKNIIALACFIWISSFWVHAQTMSLDWAGTIGGSPSSITLVKDVTTDPSGNSIFVGAFDETIDFDPSGGVQVRTPNGLADAYISKFDADGNLLWIRTIGGAGNDTAQVVVTNPQGEIYVAGAFQFNVDFDPGSGSTVLAGGPKGIYCMKLSAAGNLIWAKACSNNGVNGAGEIYDMQLDPTGNVLMTGNFDGTTDFDPGAGTDLHSSYDPCGFVWKLDANGNFKWATNVQGSAASSGFGIDVDHLGNCVVIGGFRATADFDPSAATLNLVASSTGIGYDTYFLKLDSLGQLIWVRQIKNANSSYGFSIAFDGVGDIYAIAVAAMNADLDPAPGSTLLVAQLPGNPSGTYMVKLSAAGNLVWAQSLEGNGGGAVAVNVVHNRIFWSGTCSAGTDLNPQVGTIFPTLAYEGGFLVQLDTTGEFRSADWFGSPSFYSGPSALHVTSDFTIYMGAQGRGRVSVGPVGTTDSLTLTGNYGSLYMKWQLDTCAGALAVINTVTGVGCAATGQATATMTGGFPPYSFSWNTVPATLDTIATFPMPGIYTLTVTDSIGCVRERSVLIEGPTFGNGFELRAGLVTGGFRAGFLSPIEIYAANLGCTPVSGQIRLVADTALTLVAAVTPPDLIAGDTLIWNHSSLLWQGPTFTNSLTFSASPTLPFGYPACFDLRITPMLGDLYPANNHVQVCYPVLSSYDPNDIAVAPQGACDAHFVDLAQPLTYTVRFQNTGNADAINVQVRDTLSAALDLSTVKVIAQSHVPLITEVEDGHILNFRFDNIHLPDSGTNEVASHGYVVFEVQPLPGMPVGTVIDNRASIYFDFNAPVLTNQVMNTLVDTIPSVDARVTQNGGILDAQAVGATYQWLDCNANMAPIAQATAAQFMPTVPGSYAVRVTEGNCSAVSVCQLVTTVGTAEATPSLNLKIYPNPNRSGLLYIDFQGNSGASTDVVVSDVTGRNISTRHFGPRSLIELELPAAPGMYFIQVKTDKGGVSTYKVIRE